MIKLIKYWIQAIRDHKKLIQINEAYKFKLDSLKADIDNLLEVSQRNEEKVIELENQLVKPRVDDAEYWNNRWTQTQIWYAAPQTKKVTEYIKYREIDEITKLAKELIDTYSLETVEVDLVPFSVLMWLESMFVSNKFRYVSEDRELWKTPEQTLADKTGDCDDFGILIYYIIREIFKQLTKWKKVSHRLKCQDVHTHYKGNFHPYAGRHLNLIWLHTDGEFYTVESTFYRDNSIKNFGKLPQKYNSNYGLINCTFTEDVMHANQSMVVSKREYVKSKKVD